jgi:hypothetical protein
MDCAVGEGESFQQHTASKVQREGGVLLIPSTADAVHTVDTMYRRILVELLSMKSVWTKVSQALDDMKERR